MHVAVRQAPAEHGPAYRAQGGGELRWRVAAPQLGLQEGELVVRRGPYGAGRLETAGVEGRHRCLAVPAVPDGVEPGAVRAQGRVSRRAGAAPGR
ncbi:hypothetical protein GCM10023097_64520 [Streptomyces collinus]